MRGRFALAAWETMQDNTEDNTQELAFSALDGYNKVESEVAMMSYRPPFTITNRMLMLVAEIAEKTGRISHYKSFESKPHLRRFLDVSLWHDTHHGLEGVYGTSDNRASCR